MSIKTDKIKYFIVAAAFFLPFSVLAAEINISPQNLTVIKDSEINIQININNVTNLFGAAFDLVFDSNVLSFVSAQKGGFLEQDGKATTLLTNVNSSNTLIVAYSRLAINGSSTGISGSGNLLTLNFKAINQGVSNLVFQNNALCDINSATNCNKIDVNWQGGSIIVNSNELTLPPTPQDIIATSSLNVEISWDASTDNAGVMGYKIYKNNILIATTTNTFYTDNNVISLTTYTYAISAYDSANNESPAAVISITTPAPIDNEPPVRFNGLPTGNLAYNTKQVDLSFLTNEDANCKYSTSANTAYVAMNNIFSTTDLKNHSQIISNLTSGIFYRYYIKCEDKMGNINNDDYIIEFRINEPPIIIVPDTSAPTMPGNIKATSSLNVSLYWNLATTSKQVSGYRVFRNGVQIATTTNPSYLDNKLSPSQKYNYAISAYDEQGNTSEQSAPVKTGLVAKMSNIFAGWFNGNNLRNNLKLVGPFAIGMRSEQVKLLQKMLAQNPEIYPEGKLTGYYGLLTMKAVQRFQKKYGIISYGNPETTGYGLAGPETRNQLNELYSGIASDDSNVVKIAKGSATASLFALVAVAFIKFIL